MTRYSMVLVVLTIALPAMFRTDSIAAPAAAQELATTPVTEALSQRFVLIVVDQPDRDLAKGDSKINMMFDTQTGRSWVLEYARKPNSNEQGYVWVEVPYAKPPTN